MDNSGEKEFSKKKKESDKLINSPEDKYFYCSNSKESLIKLVILHFTNEEIPKHI